MADDQGERRSSVLPMGSLFEGALFVLFEVMVLKLIDAAADQPRDDARQPHQPRVTCRRSRHRLDPLDRAASRRELTPAVERC